ncbi:MAG: SRPBCC family protein [Anaerolineae bacterium]|nr:SRPBCC family protein [Anaerolineae bacterium]MDW8173337.1 SRPBCC family protein [Anaerolineae bacterium]
MTTVIDHAIQMPATPSFIWQRIGNLENNVDWQINCKAIAYLTGTRRGVGTRWRSSALDGRDTVLEITAWYENMGYEYKVIDGGPFTHGRGRLRLQEIAEGTIVQWTFTYEASGLMGSLRNSLSLRRQIDSLIVESLRKLYRLVKEQGGKIDMESVRSLMRDAPAYEQRQGYKPRYPSALDADNKVKSVIDRSPSSAHHLPVHEVEDDDTRPNPIVHASESVSREIASDTTENFSELLIGTEPSFLSAVPAISSSGPERREDLEKPSYSPLSASSPQSKPHLPPSSDSKPSGNQPPRIESPIAVALETREVSVFDLFGVPRPSKTQEMRAVSAEVRAVSPPESTQAPIAQSSHAPRSGYRLRARRQFPRLRTPSTRRS